MFLTFFFSTLIIALFSQPTDIDVEDPFECCNKCSTANYRQCDKPFYWPNEAICLEYEQPFFPDNFCPDQDPSRGYCYCTIGGVVPDPISGTVNQPLYNPICVRGLTEYVEDHGKFLCQNAPVCDITNPVCPENYYCVETCCNQLFPNIPDHRCVPCCNEPLLTPTPDPTTPQPTTEDPTTPQPTTPQPTPRPVPVQDTCPCEEALPCAGPIKFPQFCPGGPWFQDDVPCPAMGAGATIALAGECSCTFELDAAGGQENRVCIRQPNDPDQGLCRCLRPCTPGAANTCPTGHHCVYSCCENAGPDPDNPYRCMPCCDTPFA